MIAHSFHTIVWGDRSAMSDFQKKLFIKLGTLVAVLVVTVGGIVFFGGNISSYADQIVSIRKELVQRIALLQSYVSLKSEYTAKAKEDISILNNLIPQQDQLIDLRRDFQFLGGGDNLDINFAFTGERTTDSPRLGAIGISLDVQGEMRNVLDFMKKLEHFHYLISIDSVTIDKKDSGGVTALLRGGVFFRK